MIGSNASKQENAPGVRSGKPPHWRRREQVATAVYVVHPTQFRAVVQQLTGTGADSPTTPLSTHAMHQRVAGGGDNGAAAGTRINAVAVAQTQAQAQHMARETRAAAAAGSGRWGRCARTAWTGPTTTTITNLVVVLMHTLLPATSETRAAARTTASAEPNYGFLLQSDPAFNFGLVTHAAFSSASWDYRGHRTKVFSFFLL